MLALHDLLHRLEVGAVDLVEFGLGRDVGRVSADQVIVPGYVVPLFDECIREVATQEAGNSGDEDLLCHVHHIYLLPPLLNVR